MVVSPKLLDEIDRKLELIGDDPSYYLRRSNKTEKTLRDLSDIHSFWLENPKLRSRILRTQGIKDSRQLRKIAREGVKRISSAWSYLNEADVGNDYSQYINPLNIIRVGRLVDPGVNRDGFRVDRVSLGLTYVPPNPLKVPELIGKFCDDLKGSEYHPVEAAVVTHLSIAGIQPFADGNKRVARLFQDRILHGYGLPPAFIPSGEREVYIDLLEQALLNREAHQIRYQRPFFDYVAGKVNVALDEILGDLKHK
jgi:Fic family protein